jgi:hypothetical protein
VPGRREDEHAQTERTAPAGTARRAGSSQGMNARGQGSGAHQASVQTTIVPANRPVR